MTQAGFLALGLLAYFGWLVAVVYRSAGTGSDHFFHAYYVDLLRRGGRKLLYAFPNFLNPTPAVDPQYFHWLLSFARGPGQLLFLSRVINPLFSVLSLAVFAALLAVESPVAPVPWGVKVLLLAFTPHFQHASNARNYGLSSRGLGLLLFLLFSVCAYYAGAGSWGWLAGAAACAWLIVGSNIFALQSILLFSAVFLVVFRQPAMAAATLAGLALFLALHPRYGRHYVRRLWGYWALYADVLAERFILLRHPSVWREWLVEIPAKWRQKPSAAVWYAYENSLLILVGFQPLALVAALAWAAPGGAASAFDLFAGRMASASLILFAATSFRPTRFFGSPERYVEMAIPFATALGADALYRAGGWLPVAACAVYAVALSVFQPWMNVFRRKKTAAADERQDFFRSVRERVDRDAAGAPVRFITNNGEWGKYLVHPDWQYVFFWPTVRDVGGIPIDELIEYYPFIRTDAVERLMDRYAVNYCLMDRKAGAPLGGAVRARVLDESPLHALYRVEPREGAA